MTECRIRRWYEQGERDVGFVHDRSVVPAERCVVVGSGGVAASTHTTRLTNVVDESLMG
jgi:hypothetical protein